MQQIGGSLYIYRNGSLKGRGCTDVDDVWSSRRWSAGGFLSSQTSSLCTLTTRHISLVSLSLVTINTDLFPRLRGKRLLFTRIHQICSVRFHFRAKEAATTSSRGRFIPNCSAQKTRQLKHHRRIDLQPNSFTCWNMFEALLHHILLETLHDWGLNVLCVFMNWISENLFPTWW